LIIAGLHCVRECKRNYARDIEASLRATHRDAIASEKNRGVRAHALRAHSIASLPKEISARVLRACNALRAIRR
jgi:hypothetical protein